MFLWYLSRLSGDKSYASTGISDDCIFVDFQLLNDTSDVPFDLAFPIRRKCVIGTNCCMTEDFYRNVKMNKSVEPVHKKYIKQ